MSKVGDMPRASSNNLTISRQASVNCIMFVYFASGACSLIDEVVWVRLLKLTLGNTVYATSIVVSVFMGGLALGALIMGRYSDRVSKRLRLYALLETLVTISALSLPFGLKLADTVYVWFYRTYHPTHHQLLIVQVIISAAILLVPSMLMGSTLPLLGRFVTALERQAGHLVGKLYALNTLGAAAGCFLAGFVLIRALGVMGALYTAAALNLLVALGGWLLSRFSTASADELPETVKAPGPEFIVQKTADFKFHLLIVAFFMSGLISIGYELLWMRSIVHLLGGFTYVFSAVLTVYLLGNVIGAGIGSRLAMRLKIPAAGFAVTLSVLGVCGLLYLPLLILWTSKVLPYLERMLKMVYSSTPALKYTLAPLLHSVFLFLVPAVIMGIGFPIALQAWANHLHKVGRSTATAYGANTIGAVMGGIITGFVLIPLLGLQLSISILGLLGIWIAAVMWLLFTRSPKPLARSALIIVAALLTILTVKTPSNLFNGVVAVTPHLPDNELLFVKEGVTSTVSVHRNLQRDTLELCSSGQAIAGESIGTRTDQKMLGHLGVLLNKNAKKVLSVGFGSGETTKCLATHQLESANCVEIAPEVVATALKFFRHINLGDRLNKQINMIYMDAKNYIHLTDSRFDVIANDSIHPRLFAENASLHTKEYFQTAAEHLNDSGIMVCWIPTYDMPAPVLNSIIGTLTEVFPYVTLWYPNRYWVDYFWLVASKQQQYYSPKHMEKEMLKDTVHQSLSEININNSLDLLAYYVADERDLRKHITNYPVNSDYSPFVEFSVDDISPQGQLFKRFVLDNRSESIYDHIDWTGFTERQKQRWLVDYKKVYAATGHLLNLQEQVHETLSRLLSPDSTDTGLVRLKYSLDGLRILPDSPALLHARASAEKELYSTGINLTFAGKIDDALALASDILEIYPQSAVAWMLRSTAIQEKGHMQRALAAALRAVELAPENADARFILGFALFSTRQFEHAIAEYRQMLQLAEQAPPGDKAKMLDALASAYAAAGRLPQAITAAQKALDLAMSAGHEDTAAVIAKQLELYKAEQARQQRH